MDKLKQILLEFVNSKKEFDGKGNHNNRFGGSDKYEYSSWDKLSPMTYEEMSTYRPYNKQESNFKHVPESFFNKKVVLGEFEVIIQHEREFRPDEENKKNTENSIGYKYENYNWDIQCNVILVYRGIYTRIAKYSDSMYYKVKYVYPRQTNWSWLTFGPERPYMLGEDHSYMRFEELIGTKKILETIQEGIESGELTFEDADIDFQPWYDSSYRSKHKPLSAYTAKSIDSEFFIASEIKDGVYKPEPNTIKEYIYPYGNYFKRDVLKKLGVHTIQLRTNAHFNISSFFDIPEGCQIKAAKSVITTYGYEKYAEDKAIVEQIKAEKKAEKARQKNIDYNNQFTLMQHGKVILDNKDKYKIIQYLEDFIAKDVETSVLETIKPLFDKFPINKFYIAYWGTYDKYELRGQRCRVYEDVEGHNKKIMDEEVFDEIYELYSQHIPSLDEKEVELAFGFEDDKVQLFGVRKGKRGKLEIFFEDYDLL